MVDYKDEVKENEVGNRPNFHKNRKKNSQSDPALLAVLRRFG